MQTLVTIQRRNVHRSMSWNLRECVFWVWPIMLNPCTLRQLRYRCSPFRHSKDNYGHSCCRQSTLRVHLRYYVFFRESLNLDNTNGQLFLPVLPPQLCVMRSDYCRMEMHLQQASRIPRAHSFTKKANGTSWAHGGPHSCCATTWPQTF